MIKKLLLLCLCGVLLGAFSGSAQQQETKSTLSNEQEQVKDVALFPIKQNGKEGYIDKTGKYIIKPQFDAARSFSEGLASVEIGDKWGFIDRTGKYVINPQFDWAGGFSEGLARVGIGSNYGYIDKTGKYIWEPSK